MEAQGSLQPARGEERTLIYQDLIVLTQGPGGKNPAGGGRVVAKGIQVWNDSRELEDILIYLCSSWWRTCDSVQNSFSFDDLGRADFPAGKQIGPDCQIGFREDSVCIVSAYLISFGTSIFFESAWPTFI